MMSIVIIATVLSVLNGIDPQITMAVIETESHFNPNSTGRHGEVGLMQLRPKFFPEVDHTIINNLRIGIKHLAEVKHVCRKIKNQAWIICYNQGPRSARRIKDPTNQSYFKKVSAALCKRAPLSGQSPLRYCRVDQEEMGQE